MGIAVAAYSSCVVQSSLPVFESKARKRSSLVAPMKTTPPAVAIGPANAPERPVCCLPWGSSSVMPSGTVHTISPVLMFTADKLSHGGFWQGQLPRTLPLASFAGALNPPNWLPAPVPRWNSTSLPTVCGLYFGFFSRKPVAPTFCMLTKNKSFVGSAAAPPQLAPPVAPGKTSVSLVSEGELWTTQGV